MTAHQAPETQDLPDPPYPATVLAHGWRFELDYQRIERSDTWPLAGEVPLAQPVLLMLWLASWREAPAGSLPSNEEVIRAKCKVPPELWPGLRDIVMRGWYRCSDGRLYHPVLTEFVAEMLARRRSAADRQALRRAKKTPATIDAGPAPASPEVSGTDIDAGIVTGDDTKPAVGHADVTRDIPVTHAGLTGEFSTDHRPKNTNTTPPDPYGVGTPPFGAAEPVPRGTHAGMACRVMKAVGIPDVNPGNPDLLVLIAAGASLDEFRGAAALAVQVQKPVFAYALAILKRQRADAKRLVDQVHHGPMPRSEKDERAARTARAVAAMLSPQGAGVKSVTEAIDVDARVVRGE